MGLDFASAFKKPFDDVKKLLIGIALSILPVVNFLAYGFMASVAKAEMKKDKKLPEWADWGNLFVKGLLIAVIGLIYALPAIIIAAVIIWPAMMSGGYGMTGVSGMMSGLFASMGLLMIVYLAIAFIAPSAVMHYIKEDKFASAFKFGSVFKKAFTGDYVVAWLVGVVYIVLLSYVLGFVPYIGSAAAMFISGITLFSLMGEVFRA